MPANEIPDVEYDDYGFDPDGVHRETGTAHDPNGFDVDGIHQATGTPFRPQYPYLTRDGGRYDDEGYNHRGLNSEGYDREGYDSSGYNEEGYDESGNSRCDNGDCEDPDCEQCSHAGFEGQLDSYGSKAHITHGWRPHPEIDLYAGHEIEMYSDREDYSDVEYVLAQLDKAYAKFGPLTRSKKCAIAKHDGSLDEWGFETVTVPLTDAQVYGIFGSFKTLGDGRCSAWDRGDDVGHHIHLSKRAITPLTLGKLLVFMNASVNRPFLESIACRQARFNHFSTKKLTTTQNSDRYEVLNVTDQTVEFRLFKSNLYSRAILKNHEFAVAAVRFCEHSAHGFGEVETSDDPLHFINFRRFVAARRRTYRYLHEFMLSCPAISTGYRNNSGLPVSITNPKERSPSFALIRTDRVIGA